MLDYSVEELRAKFGGVFHCKIIRAGKIIDEWFDPNVVVNEGLNYMLDVMFNGSSPTTTWYLAPFEGNYTPIATDTAATFPASATESTAYTQSTRVQYVTAAAAAQTVTNTAAPSTFTFNATKTIYGASMNSISTKSSTAGKLFAAARFSTSKSVASSDQLLMTYQFTASST